MPEILDDEILIFSIIISQLLISLVFYRIFETIDFSRFKNDWKYIEMCILRHGTHNLLTQSHTSDALRYLRCNKWLTRILRA